MSLYHQVVINERGETVDVNVEDFLIVPDELLSAWAVGTCARNYRWSGLSIHASGTPPQWLFESQLEFMLEPQGEAA